MMYPATTATRNLYCRPLARLRIHEEKGSDEDVHRRECALCLSVHGYVYCPRHIAYMCISYQFRDGKGSQDRETSSVCIPTRVIAFNETTAWRAEIFLLEPDSIRDSQLFSNLRLEEFFFFFFFSICEYFFFFFFR